MSVLVLGLASYPSIIPDLDQGITASNLEMQFVIPAFSQNVTTFFLVIDEDSIDSGNPPNFFSDVDVNDDIADIGVRAQLPFFAANVGETITLHTGEVGDEGWFALKTIPTEWDGAGDDDGLLNYLNAVPGLGSGDNPEDLLDKIPDVTPLRATGLSLLVDEIVCAVVYDSDVSINYDPLDGSLKGDNLGIVAFKVISVSQLFGFSSSSLPEVEIEILDAEDVCDEELELFTDAPVPISSSEPFDVEVVPSNGGLLATEIEGEDEEEEVEAGEEEYDEEEIELEGTIVGVSDPTFELTLLNGTTITISTDGETEFEDGLEGFADLEEQLVVEVEVVPSNGDWLATEIELGEEEVEEVEEEEEAEEGGIELEGIINSTNQTLTTFDLELLNGTIITILTNNGTEFEDGLEEFADLEVDLVVEVEVVPSNGGLLATEIEPEEEEYEDMSYAAMIENEEEAIQTALDLIYELQQKIEQLEDRIQTLLEKYESGEYFGTVPEVDSEIKSYIISFEGNATSIDDESIVIDMDGEIFIENLLTIDDKISKFSVVGGEISIDNTFYDIVFGKARVSSSDPSGEKDIVVLLGEVIDFADEDHDSSTLKLVIHSETSLEGDFGLDPISIDILPQSKISGQWSLSATGHLSLL